MLVDFEVVMDHKNITSKKATMKPMKMLISDEKSKGSYTKKYSSNIIAKLMGLDPLPLNSLVQRQKRSQSEISSKKVTAKLREDRITNVACALPEKVTISKGQEFRDVYEVLGSPKIEEHYNRSQLKEEKLAAIRKRFLNARHFDHTEKSRESEEFDDALETLGSNNDVFVKILQEQESIRSRHHLDWKEPSQLSHITVLKSAKRSTRSSKPMGFNQVEERVTSKDKFSISEIKSELSHLPTKIVVLKPSLQNVPTYANFDLSLENPQSADGKLTETRRSGNRYPFSHSKDKSNISTNPNTLGKRSQQFTGFVYQQKENARSSHIRDETYLWGKYTACRSSQSSAGMDSKGSRFQKQERMPYGSDNECPSFSSSSMDSYVHKEARKHLCEKWKMNQAAKREGSAGMCKNTLAEMLDVQQGSSPSSKCCMHDLDFLKDDFLNEYRSVGLSSHHSWKDTCPMISRSRSLSSSSSCLDKYGVWVSRNKDHKDENGDRGSPTSAYMDVDEALSSISMKYGRDFHYIPSATLFNGQPEDVQLAPISKAEPFQSGAFLNHRAVVEDANASNQLAIAEISDGCAEEIQAEPASYTLKYCSRGSNITEQQDLVLQGMVTNESSHEHSWNSMLETESSESSCKDAEQPSPVSVLEPLLEEEGASTECFQKVSADLHGLRMQLQLLKSESNDDYMEESDVCLPSDEESDEHMKNGEQESSAQLPWRENNRDFFFLVDVLKSSGLNPSSMESVFATCHTWEFPVDVGTFQKLELKYGDHSGWCRAERKLLFDRINHVVAEILGFHINQKPWISKTRVKSCNGQSIIMLAEKVWQMLTSAKDWMNELPSLEVLDSQCGWMTLHDDIDAIGRNLEGYFLFDLIDEMLGDFLL